MKNYVEQWKKEHAKEIEINVEINKQKAYLNKTDYIALKIAEADDNKKEALKQLYSQELKKREECREKINELEEELKTV